ncbi:major facilitator superfamily domain-containing protein [Mycena olivaceomarginata]|nr:major facilitator superfamily domain-containing protein [Mycena olivaceomarginata]
MSTHSGYRRLRALSDPTTDDAVDPSPEIVQTQRAEITRSYGKHAKWALFISLGLAAYIYSLDSTTTYTFLTYATSEFKSHSLLGSIQVAQGIIIAVGKPVIAKIADVGSRGTAYFGVCKSAFLCTINLLAEHSTVIFYVVGYTVIATAQSIQTVFAGVLLYAMQVGGLQLLTQVVIADITTLKWRGLVLSLNSVPFLINAFSVLAGGGGYGLFAILIPIGLSPLIITLFWSERITRRKRQTHARGGPKKTYTQRLLDTAEELDAVGLLLIGASISLTLLPISLAKYTENWRDATGMLAIFVLGLLFIPLFALWDFRWANYPVIPFRFVVNRSVIGASLIGAFDFLAFYLTYTYLFSFVVVVKGWKLINTTYFMQLQSIAMTLCGILTGIYMHRFRRYKMLLVSGLVIRLLGVALMLHSRGSDGSDLALVMTQVLQGIGGGIAALSIQVSSQASVLHGDVAMVTAVVLLITEFGGAGGGAIAGAIWSSEMPSKLAQHLPFLSQAERDKLFSSITEAASKPRGDPVREGVISAYGDVMKTMVFTGIVVSVLPILVALVMPDLYLGDQTAAGEVSEEQVAGGDSDEDEDE